MIIASSLRSQRQFRSTFVDVFEARQISLVTSRRTRSEQIYPREELDLAKTSSGLLQVAHTQCFSNEPVRTRSFHQLVQEHHVPSQQLTEPHISLSSSSFQEKSTELAYQTSNRASQPIDHLCLTPTNDVPASIKISANVCTITTPSKKISEEVERLLDSGVFKPSAQNEWEKLWYHGVESAFQKIAAKYPEIEPISKNTLPSQSISEPSLNISALSQEDRKVFEKEEKTRKQTFLPKTETERVTRLQRAKATVDAQERLAILLGLPTYSQYLLSKVENTQNSNLESLSSSKRQQKRRTRFAEKKQHKVNRLLNQSHDLSRGNLEVEKQVSAEIKVIRAISSKVIKTEDQEDFVLKSGMTHQQSQASDQIPIGGAQHRPLVVGLTKPPSIRSASTMASSADTVALNKEIAENVKTNTAEAGPTEDNPTAPAASKPKKEKAPKQPKAQKAAPVTAPTAPAIIDLRVGHILRAIAHPNADSLYVSTIAMGDPEGTEHTQIDEETGKVVRTVCSGLNGLVPLEEMQDRKIIVVANLKPVNMRSIKSAAMVLAASPKQPEGTDSHAPDRVVELVLPPEGAEAGDKVYFEGWPYGEGKGPEKQLNPKKKQWEAIQPGFYTGNDLVVGFDASQCDEVEGDAKGNLVVEGKGVCTVKTLKGAVVR